MKERITSALQLSSFLFTAAIVGSGCASLRSTDTATEYPQEKPKIEERLREIFDAAEKKDFDRLESYHLYGPKFTKFSTSSAARQDAAAARKGEHDGLAAINDLKMQAKELKIDVFGEVTVVTFAVNASFKSGTNPISKDERATLVLVNDHGSWKITHEHFSPVPSNP